MAMQLRVRHIPSEDAPRGGVPVLGSHDLLCLLLHNLPLVTTPHNGHRLSEMPHRFPNRGGMGCLHVLALVLIPECPHHRD
jgi:hypothetical protein